MNEELERRLQQTNRNTGTIVPDDMDTSVNSQGQRSEIGEYQAQTATLLRPGMPLRVAVPAYYGDTTNATADDTETFTLPFSVVDAPVTQSVVVWLDGTYYGTPDSVDYGANEITVTDSGTGSNLHVYYISDAAATLELRKSVPSSSTSGAQQVYKSNLALVHPTKQTEQPEDLDVNDTELHPWLGTDMTLTAYIEAPYTVRWTDPDGDGTEPTNAMLNVPAMIGANEVPGLTSAVKQDMGEA